MTGSSDQSSNDRILIRTENRVADVRLNRPDKLNALDRGMFTGLAAAAEQIAATPGIRAVVLSGEGRSFSAGLDFASFLAEPEQQRPDFGLLSEYEKGPATLAQIPAWAWRDCPQPVIAAVTGHAFGGGLQIALAADIRLASPDAVFSVMEIRWGLIPDMTATQTLRHLVGIDHAKELSFTGRKVGAEEALRLGLITRIEENPHAAAMELAAEIAANSPDAVRAAKRVFHAGYEGTAADGLREEAREQSKLIGSANQLAAVQANMMRQPADFTDPE